MRAYLLNVAGTLTQGLNALLGGNRDQSFSSRSFEAYLVGRPWGRLAVTLIDTLFYRGHCEAAFLSDTERTYASSP